MGREEAVTDPAAVEAALDEFDRIGREEFLRKYGIGRARRYLIRRLDRQYDAKAIVGAAHGYQYPAQGPLRADEFRGEEGTVVRLLEGLGFDVVAVSDQERDGSEAESSLSACLESILARQREWASTNTPAMEQRGLLVRHEVPSVIRKLLAPLEVPFPLSVEGSDGAGRKSRVPWVRIFDKARSPRATEGWYVVFLFAADGSAAFLSLGIGSTYFEGGQHHERPDAWLTARIAWARQLLSEAAAGDERLLPHEDLKHPGGLGDSYEKGTVFCYRYPSTSVPGDHTLAADIERMVQFLGLVYATAEPSTAKALAVYIGSASLENFRVGLDKSTWGFRQKRSEYEDLRVGDWVVFAVGGGGGGPRVPADKWAQKLLSTVVVGQLTSGLYEDTTPLWPDETAENAYPFRIAFRQISRLQDVPMIPGQFGPSVIEGLRRAGASGQGVVVEADGDVLGDIIGTAKDMPASFQDLTLELVQHQLDARKLLMPPSVVASVIAALRAQKNVILTGPPGTGKTELALAVADAARSVGLCRDVLSTTATADWTSVETIGGYRLDKDKNLQFRPGCVLEAIDREEWLIIDEFNRADIDKALGQLFTALSGQAVTLPYIEVRNDQELAPAIVPDGASAPAHSRPYRIAPTWRIIATLNSRDRDLLFNMSYALLRRFAVIDVPNPPPLVNAQIFQEKASTGSAELDESLQALGRLPHRPMSPAILIDCGRYSRQRLALDAEEGEGVTPSEILQEALFSFVIPQLDDLSNSQLHEVVAYLQSAVLKSATVKQVAFLMASALQVSADDLLPNKQSSGPGMMSDEDTEDDAAAVEPS